MKEQLSERSDFGSRIELLDTRISDLQGFVKLIVTGAAILFGLMGIVFAWNASSEKADLRAFKQEIREELRIELGKTVAQPTVELLTREGQPLDGAKIVPKVSIDSDGDTQVYIPLIFHNVGRGQTGECALKVYTKATLPMMVTGSRSTDEPSYDYEKCWIGVEDSGLQNLPGGLSYAVNLYFIVDLPITEVPAGLHEVLLKVYYGSGLHAQAEVKLDIPNLS